MDPSTIVLTDIAIILIIGVLLSLIAQKLRISNVLLLVLAGIAIGSLSEGTGHFIFSDVFLVSMGMFTLSIIVFRGTSDFSLKDLSRFSLDAAKFIFWFLLTNAIILTIVVVIVFFKYFTVYPILFALVFSVLMIATDAGTVFMMFKGKHKVTEFLELESLLNDPLMVVVPFIILSIIKNVENINIAEAIIDQFVPFLQQVIVAVGAGIVIGIILLQVMRRFYSPVYSPVGLIAVMLLTYIIAENLKGNGVFAVATLGIVFGNSSIKEKDVLKWFNDMLDSMFAIIVFILIGIIVKVDFTQGFLLDSLIVFGFMVLSRFLAVTISMRHSDFSFGDKLFITLNMPKGIAAAVVAFSLSVFGLAGFLIPYMEVIMQLTLVTMVYSLILSTFVARFGLFMLSPPDHKTGSSTADEGQGLAAKARQWEHKPL